MLFRARSFRPRRRIVFFLVERKILWILFQFFIYILLQNIFSYPSTRSTGPCSGRMGRGEIRNFLGDFFSYLSFAKPSRRSEGFKRGRRESQNGKNVFSGKLQLFYAVYPKILIFCLPAYQQQ